MTTDFRALCTELVDIITAHANPDDCAVGYVAGVLTRARAALADEPAVPENRAPTQDELWELWLRLNNELPDRPAAVAEFWEHAQINARACWGNPAPQPPSEGEPSDEELLRAAAFAIEPHDIRWSTPAPPLPADRETEESVEWLMVTAGGEGSFGRVRSTRAAELQQQVLVPVSVSERPPGPKDCDAKGRCWWGEPQIGDSHDATWNLCTQDDAQEFLTWGTKCGWLPAHALPIPQQQQQQQQQQQENHQ